METSPPALPDLRMIPLHDVTREYGAPGLREQFLQHVDDAEFTDEDKARIYSALELSEMAHNGQQRGEHPYITHVLRVSTRTMKHFQVTDPNIVIAALLHDSVEDRPGRLVIGAHATEDQIEDISLKSWALGLIRGEFGGEVATLVAAVTNPEFDNSQDVHSQYRTHVMEATRANPKARIIKLSDFLDNCSGLIYNESPSRAARLARKYQPLIPFMIAMALDTATPLTAISRGYIVERLERANLRCDHLIA